jgi:hypothetical protein
MIDELIRQLLDGFGSRSDEQLVLLDRVAVSPKVILNKIVYAVGKGKIGHLKLYPALAALAFYYTH